LLALISIYDCDALSSGEEVLVVYGEGYSHFGVKNEGNGAMKDCTEESGEGDATSEHAFMPVNVFERDGKGSSWKKIAGAGQVGQVVDGSAINFGEIDRMTVFTGAVQMPSDALTAALVQRYKSGGANVDALLND
jgi:hypothetical protein